VSAASPICACRPNVHCSAAWMRSLLLLLLLLLPLLLLVLLPLLLLVLLPLLLGAPRCSLAQV